MATSSLPAAQKSQPQTTLGKLKCSGPVTYQTGIGPWIRQAGGECLVALPLSVKTGESKCRVTIGTSALFDARPGTQIHLAKPESIPLSMTVSEGIVLYSISENEVLAINIPGGVRAVAGNPLGGSTPPTAFTPVSSGGTSADSLNGFSRDEVASFQTGAVHMGIVNVTGSDSAELYNYRGSLVYRDETDELRSVEPGNTPVHVAALLQSPRSATMLAPPNVTSPLDARVYYVAANGSDASGNGSMEQPWASISHALGQVNDGSTITVRAGTYVAPVELHGDFKIGVWVLSEEPYQAQLRNDGTVVTFSSAQRITMAGFDIAPIGTGGAESVIYIKGPTSPNSEDLVSTIALVNNVIHDNMRGDLVRIDRGAEKIVVEGNAFYNQGRASAHVNVNGASEICIQDNVFFNDLEGVERVNINDTGSYVLVHDSDAPSGADPGSRNVKVRRNVFYSWQGSPDSCFVQLGRDGRPYHEAFDVLVENNLMLGNSANVMRSPIGVQGVRQVTFRHNTVAGDLPAHGYGMYVGTTGQNPVNDEINFYNNLWSDPTGTMGVLNESQPPRFSDTPIGQTKSYAIHHNTYWNDGEEIPRSDNDMVNPNDDGTSTVGNPLLGKQTRLEPARWDPAKGEFADGSKNITQAHRRLVMRNGAPAKIGRPVIDVADAEYAPKDDILRKQRPSGAVPDIGAYEQTRLVLWYPAVGGVVAGGALGYGIYKWTDDDDDDDDDDDRRRRRKSPWRPPRR